MLVDRAKYLAVTKADMVAYDALPPAVRAAMAQELTCPPAQEVAQWIILRGQDAAIRMIHDGCRACHNQAAAAGEVAPLVRGDFKLTARTNRRPRTRPKQPPSAA